jgi:Zn-dependent protease with chaperone function
MIDWLELFHPESLVELDYGGLAGYLDAALRAQGLDGINEDSSIEDVAFSLSGLSAGDGSIAGQGYERLVSRWRTVQAYESAI